MLQKKLETLGSYFYENVYYNNDSIGITSEEKIKSVSKYKDSGIKINLQNLKNIEQYKNEVNNSFMNCDFENTKAVIYPQEPYGSSDYHVVADLHCVFDK